MTWKLYRHDDAGAPTLDTSKGSMINLLEKCLVTGYGTEDQTTDPPDTPWKVEKSDDGLHAVFWSDAADGSGHYFYIRDDGENDGDAGDDQVKAHGRECYLQGALTFTGFTNGKPDLADIFPDPGTHPRGLAWPKNESQPKTCAWWVCGDSRTAYLFWVASADEKDFSDSQLDWGDHSRIAGFGDLIDLIDASELSFIDGRQGTNIDDMQGNSLLSQDPSHVFVSSSADGSPGGNVAAPYSSAIQTGRSGAVQPSDINDLSGPLFSQQRQLVLDTQNIVSLYRIRGYRELSLIMRDNSGQISHFFENLMGVPNGDPSFATFDFGGRTLLALPGCDRAFRENVLFIDVEDDQ